MTSDGHELAELPAKVEEIGNLRYWSECLPGDSLTKLLSLSRTKRRARDGSSKDGAERAIAHSLVRHGRMQNIGDVERVIVSVVEGLKKIREVKGASHGEIRPDTVGYVIGNSKIAFKLMDAGLVIHTPFPIQEGHGLVTSTAVGENIWEDFSPEELTTITFADWHYAAYQPLDYTDYRIIDLREGLGLPITPAGQRVTTKQALSAIFTTGVSFDLFGIKALTLALCLRDFAVEYPLFYAQLHAVDGQSKFLYTTAVRQQRMDAFFARKLKLLPDVWADSIRALWAAIEEGTKIGSAEAIRSQNWSVTVASIVEGATVGEKLTEGQDPDQGMVRMIEKQAFDQEEEETKMTACGECINDRPYCGPFAALCFCCPTERPAYDYDEE